ncbi:MAG: SLC13 family permease [Nitrospinota bacterium]
MEQALTFEITLVLIVIVIAIFLFITELVRVDVVAIIMMVLLPILGLVTPSEAFSGFSSNAVISIIAVIIIGAGLDKTGLMNRVAAPIIRFSGASLPRLIAGISGTVAIISSFMQNIGAAALFMPATMRVSRQLNIPLSKLLMPMGFCAILGGTVTLVGSSPLILLNDLLATANLEPFGLFSVTPIGLLLVAAGIGYFIILGPIILPAKRTTSGEQVGGSLKLLAKYSASLKVFELIATDDLKFKSKTLKELNSREMFFVTVVAIKNKNSNEIIVSPSQANQISKGDLIGVLGHIDNVKQLADYYGFQIKPKLDIFERALDNTNTGYLEAIISPESSLIGKTLRQNKFIHNFGISTTAIYRKGKVFRGSHVNIPLQVGDTLLLYGTWHSFVKLKNSSDLLLPSADSIQDIFEVHKMKTALFSFGVALTLLFSKGLFATYLGIELTLSVCLMTGALLMILTKTLSVDDAYKAVDWRTIFLLAGLIPLGLATQKSKAAEYIANMVLNGLGDISPLMLLLVIAVMSTLFTLVISNVGATVLLVPIAISMAQNANTDPRIAALVVGLAVSNSFILPTHQVNALMMGPGRYTTLDFVRAGGGMSILFIVIMLFGLWAFYGIT